MRLIGHAAVPATNFQIGQWAFDQLSAPRLKMASPAASDGVQCASAWSVFAQSLSQQSNSMKRF